MMTAMMMIGEEYTATSDTSQAVHGEEIHERSEHPRTPPETKKPEENHQENPRKIT